MISVNYNKPEIKIDGQWIEVTMVEKIDDNIVSIFLSNDLNNCWFTLLANETTINDVLQTSAQMIYDTLTSNV